MRIAFWIAFSAWLLPACLSVSGSNDADTEHIDSGTDTDTDTGMDADTDSDTDSDIDTDSDTDTSTVDDKYQWHTFYGNVSMDVGDSLAADMNGNIYVTGYSWASWDGPDGQSPLNPHSGYFDIFVLKLDANGTYQ